MMRNVFHKIPIPTKDRHNKNLEFFQKNKNRNLEYHTIYIEGSGNSHHQIVLYSSNPPILGRSLSWTGTVSLSLSLSLSSAPPFPNLEFEVWKYRENEQYWSDFEASG